MRGKIFNLIGIILFTFFLMGKSYGKCIIGYSDANHTYLTFGLGESSMNQAANLLKQQGFELKSISSWEKSTLAGLDIAFVGLLNQKLSEEEKNNLHDFVLNGGSLVIQTDSHKFNPYIKNLADSFGIDLSRQEVSNNTLIYETKHSIINGDHYGFGEVNNYQPQTSGAANTNPDSSLTALIMNENGQTLVGLIEFEKLAPGSGAVVFFGDVNAFTDDYIDEGTNKILWQNTFAYLKEHTCGQVNPIPEPSTVFLLSISLIGYIAFKNKLKN